MEQKAVNVKLVKNSLKHAGYSNRLVYSFISAADIAIYVEDGGVDEEELFEDFEDHCMDLRCGIY